VAAELGMVYVVRRETLLHLHHHTTVSCWQLSTSSETPNFLHSDVQRAQQSDSNVWVKYGTSVFEVTPAKNHVDSLKKAVRPTWEPVPVMSSCLFELFRLHLAFFFEGLSRRRKNAKKCYDSFNSIDEQSDSIDLNDSMYSSFFETKYRKMLVC